MTWLLVLSVLYTLYFAKNLLFPVFIAPVHDHVPSAYGTGVAAALDSTVDRCRHHYRAGAFYFFSAFVWLSTPAGEWLDRAPGIILETKHKLYEFKTKIEQARKTTEQLQDMTTGDAGKNEKVVVEAPSLTLQVIGHARSFGLTALILIVLLYLLLVWGGILESTRCRPGRQNCA